MKNPHSAWQRWLGPLVCGLIVPAVLLSLLIWQEASR